MEKTKKNPYYALNYYHDYLEGKNHKEKNHGQFFFKKIVLIQDNLLYPKDEQTRKLLFNLVEENKEVMFTGIDINNESLIDVVNACFSVDHFEDALIISENGLNDEDDLKSMYDKGKISTFHTSDMNKFSIQSISMIKDLFNFLYSVEDFRIKPMNQSNVLIIKDSNQNISKEALEFTDLNATVTVMNKNDLDRDNNETLLGTVDLIVIASDKSVVSHKLMDRLYDYPEKPLTVIEKEANAGNRIIQDESVFSDEKDHFYFTYQGLSEVYLETY